ncbi:ral guanine nucleotide dissociation stimulator-like 3 [Sigmodon hispidus]
MERTAGRELALAPLQDWGEESEDGAVYSVSLRRQRSQRSTPRGPGADQAPTPATDTFLQYRTSKVRALRAARLERLVHELVSGDREQDPGFVPAFLATHRAFVPTARVLSFLLPPPPPPPPPGIDSKRAEGQDLSYSRNLRAVVSVLGSWLRDHPQDFRDPPAHQNLGNVRIFLDWAAPGGAEAREAEKLLEGFLEESKGKQAEEEQRLAWAGPPRAAQPPRSEFAEDLEEEERPCSEGPELLDFSVDEVAEQLTLMDVELFLRVRTCECLGSMWSQRDRPGAAGISPTVRATVAQFNAVTGCVLGSLLQEPGLAASQRAQRIEKWIRIAQIRTLNKIALLGLFQAGDLSVHRNWGTCPISRLSLSPRLLQTLNYNLSDLGTRLKEETTEGSHDDDCIPGSLPSKLPPGPVPYLGTFLTDLVMLDTALPDMLKGNLINFEKRRKEWEILARIQQLQHRCQLYSLSSHPSVLAALRAQRQLSEDQSYRVSRVIEPPAASCPSSPSIRRRVSLTKRLSAKLSREKNSSPGGSPGDPSSPTSSVSPGSPPSSPRSGEPPGSPPASPGPQSPSNKLPLNMDTPMTLTLSNFRIPVLGQQTSEARVIRVSIDNNHGNLYRSILLTCQDKAPSVVQRALEKHNVPQPWARDYQLFQVLPGDKELLIPDNANVFYAMSPAAPGDFLLRRKEGTGHRPSASPT